LPQENALFSGDHVMAWSTTVVAPPDGNMRAYMDSLEKLRTRHDRIFWPGHGGPVASPQSFLRGLIQHRHARENAIFSHVIGGDSTIPQIVAGIYKDLDPRLAGAARYSVMAHLEALCERGLLRADPALGLNSRYFKA
jgi:glyoxylase-like metal-dependent hydrolase (beta-lactamase superfamily II)